MIKRIVLLVLAFFVFGRGECFGRHQLANRGKAGLRVYSIDRTLKLDDDEIDIGTAALVLSRQWGTQKILMRYRNIIDEMADDVFSRLEDARVSSKSPRAVGILNKYLFEEKEFGSVKTANNPNDLFLHNVLEKNRGYCLSLSVLYLAIGERIGLDLHGVVVPGHFFVRYDDGRTRFNIETTSKGAIVPDKHYLDKFKPYVGGKSLYMKNLTNRQTIGCFFNNLGNSYSNVGDFDSASWALERAVEINPSLGEAHLNLGNMYLRFGWPDDAIKRYLTAKSLLPEDVKVYSNLGSAYSQKGRLKEAEDCFNKALKLDADFVEASRGLAGVYYKKGKVREAIALLVQIARKDTNDIFVRYQLAEIYRGEKNYSEAINYYKRTTRLDREYTSAYVGLGLCYLELKSYGDAATVFQKAVSLDKGNVRAYWGLAEASGKLGLAKEEIGAYENILELEPENGNAWMNAGSAYLRQNNFVRAIEAYEQALKFSEDKSDIYYNLGVVFSQQEDYAGSIKYYVAAIESNAGNASAYYNVAISRYNVGEYEVAWEDINQAIKLGFEVSSDIMEAIENRIK